MVERFTEDAELVFEGVPVGPFTGRQAIAGAYRDQPPDDKVAVVSATERADGTIVTRYGWLRDDGREAGEMRITRRGDRIARLVVTFDQQGTASGSATDSAPLDPQSSGATSRSLDAGHGKPLVYLDSASRARSPRSSSMRLDAFYRQYNANVHPEIYDIGERATAAYEEARIRVARFINAPTPTRSSSLATRPRRSPSLPTAGPPQHRRGRRDRPDRDGAFTRTSFPWQLLVQGEGTRPGVHPDHGRRHPSVSTCSRSSCA